MAYATTQKRWEKSTQVQNPLLVLTEALLHYLVRNPVDGKS